MKAWRDISAVPKPKGIAALPLDARGYPIPVNVRIVGGVPEFTVICADRSARLVQCDLCGLCGVPLGRYRGFVGGPKSIKLGSFTDLPSHPECARYALQVCPFLAAPSFSYSRKERENTTTDQRVSTTRPEVFGLMIVSRGNYQRLMAGYLVNHPDSIEWWKDGNHCSPPQPQGD